MSLIPNTLALLLAEGNRSRSSWNDRLTHWERPASESEEVQIERAASMVRFALAENAWLRNEGVEVGAISRQPDTPSSGSPWAPAL
jgi:hypothetical protein